MSRPVTSTEYNAIHQRLRYQRGPAKEYGCIVAGCERSAQDWAWDRTGPSLSGADSHGRSITWGTDIATYYPMCASHASMMDHGGTLTHCPNGHNRAEVGTHANGVCAACQRERAAAQYAKTKAS